ncbi:biotin--acetyl-CoA-carboxylase, putative [Plasmodium relictum]|uniref:Biotin--acetyl-CoA-carboxylase, putative n=1 Tax=Plasmodium relictum TaxID=85471 RepID=A0A1J1H6A4_PLARL|nr:biotin--acetyl-CoA-carboxylase, putative [Plasmodium relictum]CRG99130.1 biotin--acetyl-CoA-carboxylase, putative [Plasmodium relictum]
MEENVLFEKYYSELNSLRFHFDVLDSTQLYCKRNMQLFIETGKLKEDNMIIVSCNSQTNGIGTRDTKKNINRLWLSKEGNIFTTFVFLWNKDDLNKVSCLAQTSTVAISKTLEHFHLMTQIKWINDVLINYKKVSGCLVNLYHFDDDILSKKYVCIMVGVGINVNLRDDKNILNNNYTSIKKELEHYFDAPSCIPSVEDIMQKLIENFHACIHKLQNEGFSTFLEYIKMRLLYNEKKVLIDQDNRQIVGYLKGLLDDGSILLLNEKNQIINVNNGHLYLNESS